jgi:hypothetical protein
MNQGSRFGFVLSTLFSAATAHELASNNGQMFNVDPYPSYSTLPSEVTEVHVIHSNHLDVGFNQRSWNDGLNRCNGSTHAVSGLTCDPFGYRVVNENFGVYYPRAAQMAKDFRAMGDNESFSYMTHSWLIELFLDCEGSGLKNWLYPNGTYNPHGSEADMMLLECPNASAIAEFKAAVTRGDIWWHAFPHNANLATYDISLLEASLNMSSDAARCR